jgi:homotetrameric cytidine deaminase
MRRWGIARRHDSLVALLTAPLRNIELKARDADPARTLERALALGSEDRGAIEQRDTYFTPARGRLKLREQAPGGAELIAYERSDAREPQLSAYRIAPVGDPEPLREALGAALGTLVVVVKRRRLLLWEDVRIHLDEVEGLGSHLELEAVAAPDSDLEPERRKLERLRAELRIDDAALIEGSYSDLLLDAPDTLLRAAETAMRRAYAPYSGFKVGAALRAAGGGVYTGANVENAAYPQGQCAEASALGALVAAGEREVVAAAVVADRVDFCPPCGGCRQRLAELAAPEAPVHLGKPGGPRRTVPLAELLPMAFDLERR